MRRILGALSILLAFSIGFLSCIGAIAGGALYIYKNLSYNQLNTWGLLSLDTSALIEEDPEVSLLDMTPETLIAEIISLASAKDDVTVNSLVSRYGLKLSEDQLKYLPESVRTVRLQSLFAKEGLDYILDETTLDYLFVYIPEEMLCTPARETISGKSLRQIVELNLTGLLSDIKIGYFLGVTYSTVDGVTTVVYADPDHPTIFELLAPLDLGHVLDRIVNSGDLVAAFTDDLGNVLLYQIAYALLSSDNTALSVMFADKTVNDLVVRGEDGNYTLAYEPLLNGHYVGELLGYSAVTVGDNIIGWTDENGENVTGSQRGISCIYLEGIGEEDFDPMNLLNGLYLGDLMNNTPVYDEEGELAVWHNAEGAELGKLENKLAMKTVGDLTGDGFSIGSLLDGIYVGDLLGYYMEEGDATVWYQDAEQIEKVKGTNSVIARIDVGRLMNDDTYEVNDAFDGVLFGEMRGYTPLYGDAENPEKVTGWEKEDGTPVTGTDRAIANIDLGRLLGDDTYEVSDAFSDVYLGEVLHYTEDLDGETRIGWLKDDGTGNLVPVTGVSATFADYTLKALMDGEVDIQTEVDSMQLCDVLGLTAREFPVYMEDGSPVMIDDGEGGTVQMIKKVWYNGADPASSVIGALAERTVSELSTCMDALQISDVLGYTDVGGTWYSGTVKTDDPVPGENYVLHAENGIIVQLCDLTLDEMKSSDTVSTRIKSTKLSVVMGYTYNEDDGKWYDGSGNPVNGFMSKLADKTVSELEGDELMDSLTIADVMNYHRDTPEDDWLDASDNKVTGIMGAIADTPISGLQTKINTVKIGEIMELTWNETAGEWQDDEGKKASGVMSAFADLTVSEMSDSEKVSQTVKNMTVGDAMGYTLEEGVWKDGDTPVTGMMKAIAGSKLGELQDDLDGVYLGEIMNYREESGVWYTEGGEPATGVMKAFAGLTVGDMKDSDAITNAIQTVKVGEAMGYYVQDDGAGNEVWYSDSACTQPVTGILKAIAGTEIGGLGARIDSLTIADALDYSYDSAEGKWVDKNGTPATGFLSLLDLSRPITELSDEVTDAFNDATMQDMIDAGLINLDTGKQDKLDQMDAAYNMLHPGENRNWREMSINDFIGHIISSI